ncbi:MAG: hypothetical protein JWL77_901 [Chthonomonadaceae bacterium]|nr:hypothetical protein [Chthonomonadaceae bacterium]
MDYRDILIMEPGKRSGKPCIRGLRITVYDVLSYLAAGMTPEEILADFPALTAEDIRACLSYAADRERQTRIAAQEASPLRISLHFFLLSFLPAFLFCLFLLFFFSC